MKTEHNYIKQYEAHQKAVFESANEGNEDNQESEKLLWWDDASYAAYQAEDRFAIAEMESERRITDVSVRINIPVEELITHLENGKRIWGGGAGVGKVTSGSTYRLDYVSEYGEGESRYYSSAFDAVWAYLKEVGGSCAITVTSGQ